MKKSLVAVLMSAVLATSSIAVPTFANNVKSATETNYNYDASEKACAYYRSIARKAITADIKSGKLEEVPDQIEIAVIANLEGDCVFFPDYNGDTGYGHVDLDNVYRGEVVAFAETENGFGECDKVNYYIVDDGFYDNTENLIHLYYAQGHEFPTPW